MKYKNNNKMYSVTVNEIILTKRDYNDRIIINWINRNNL